MAANQLIPQMHENIGTVTFIFLNYFFLKQIIHTLKQLLHNIHADNVVHNNPVDVVEESISAVSDWLEDQRQTTKKRQWEQKEKAAEKKRKQKKEDRKKHMNLMKAVRAYRKSKKLKATVEKPLDEDVYAEKDVESYSYDELHSSFSFEDL